MKTTHRILHHNSYDSFPLKDNSVNLVVTSPPYPMIAMWDQGFVQQNSGIGRSLKKGEGMKAFEKMHKLLDQTWKEVFRVLKPGGFAVINIGDATRSFEGHFQVYSNHSRIIQACAKIGFDVLPYIIWQKPTNAPNKFMGSGMLPGGAYVTLEHEHILIFRKGVKREFDKKEKEKRRQSAMFWEERNEWFSDHWDIRGTKQKLEIDADRDRSGAYPIEIALRPILMYSIYGDLVLDPFAGTGTSALACMLSGRNSVMFDADETLVNSSKKWIADNQWIQACNDRIDKRLLDHLEYAKSKESLYFKYRHEEYQVPIKTRQEKVIQHFKISETHEVKNKLSVTYERQSFPL